jgi:hypothetical protein
LLGGALETRFLSLSGRSADGSRWLGGGRLGAVLTAVVVDDGGGGRAPAGGGRGCNGAVTAGGAAAGFEGPGVGCLDGGAGAHLCSPSWSIGMGTPQSAHLMVGRSWDILGSEREAARRVEVIVVVRGQGAWTASVGE